MCFLPCEKKESESGCCKLCADHELNHPFKYNQTLISSGMMNVDGDGDIDDDDYLVIKFIL